MGRPLRAGLLATLVAAAGCAHAPASDTAPTTAQLVGTWHGNAVMLGDPQLRGDDLQVTNADGSFVAYFRLCRNGTLREVVVESGRWEYADGVVKTTTQTVNGRNVPPDDFFIERYRASTSGSGRLRLVSLKTHDVFDQRRVDTPGFVLPTDPCTMAVQKPGM